MANSVPSAGIIRPATAAEANRVSMAIQARGGEFLEDPHYAQQDTFPFPGAHDAVNSYNRKLWPNAVNSTEITIKGCGHAARAEIPMDDGPLRFCAICDGAHAWPEFGG